MFIRAYDIRVSLIPHRKQEIDDGGSKWYWVQQRSTIFVRLVLYAIAILYLVQDHRSLSLYFWQWQCSKAHGCIVWHHDRWFSLYALALFDTPDLASVLPDIVHDCLYRYRRTILCVAISPKFLKAPYLLPFIPCKLRYRLLSLDTEHLSKTQVIVLRTFVFS